jgi:hypothetical protein
MRTSSLILIALVLSMLLFPTLTPARAQAGSPTLSVVYRVNLSPRYSIYASVNQHAFVQAAGSLPGNTKPIKLNISFLFNFQSVSLPPGANYSISKQRFFTIVVISLPPSTSFNVTLAGFFQDYSVLYRNSATIPFVSASLGVPPYSPTSFKVVVPLSGQTQVVSVYPSSGPNVVAEQFTVDGRRFLSADFSPQGSILITYQNLYRNYFLILYFAVIVAAVFILPLLFRKAGSLSSAPLRRIRSVLVRLVRSLDSRRLLALFVAVCAIMMTVSLVVGPSPTPKVYLAATPPTAAQLGPYITAAGFQYLTPLNAGDEFDRISGLGNFHAVIIADFPVPPNADGVTASFRIIAMTQYLPATYVTTLQTLYPNSVTTVRSTAELSRVLTAQRFYARTNVFGLNLDQNTYQSFVEFEGVLTFVVVFFALAFFARFIMERTGKGFIVLAEAIAFSFLIFMFSQMVFIQTSVLLGIPVSLHATISPVESAVGALGFGGGSRPRLLAGALGFLFGALAGKGGRIKLDRVGFFVFAAMILFLAADPLSLGGVFYDWLLSVSTGEQQLAASVHLSTAVRQIITRSFQLFGTEGFSRTYFAQHGASLFYVGAVPFALYNKLSKSTGTILLMFCAVTSAFGFVRIGDLFPPKAVASTMPGVLLAFLPIAAFLVLSITESRIRKTFFGP